MQVNRILYSIDYAVNIICIYIYVSCKNGWNKIHSFIHSAFSPTKSSMAWEITAELATVWPPSSWSHMQPATHHRTLSNWEVQSRLATPLSGNKSLMSSMLRPSLSNSPTSASLKLLAITPPIQHSSTNNHVHNRSPLSRRMSKSKFQVKISSKSNPSTEQTITDAPTMNSQAQVRPCGCASRKWWENATSMLLQPHLHANSAPVTCLAGTRTVLMTCL